MRRAPALLALAVFGCDDGGPEPEVLAERAPVPRSCSVLTEVCALPFPNALYTTRHRMTRVLSWRGGSRE